MSEQTRSEFTLSCPIPISEYPRILLAHGGGGKLTKQLIEKFFVPQFHNPLLDAMHDGSVFSIGNARMAFSTDSYVIKPLFFPGGNIGELAVYGTVNDLVMCGSKPMYLSAGFIIEEGFPIADLWRIVQAMQNAATAAHVQIITGDTKVVDRGKGDGIFINTAGVGVIGHDFEIAPRSILEGDVIILSGDIGRHGIAIMAMREGLEFETTIESDCAPLAELILPLLDSGIAIHCMRDLTRGGMASALVEIAESASMHITIEEKSIPIREEVQGACEILGFDPLYVANEGRCILFVPESHSRKALDMLRAHPLGIDATIVGSVSQSVRPLVTMKTKIGGSRIVDMMTGEQLPRIC